MAAGKAAKRGGRSKAPAAPAAGRGTARPGARAGAAAALPRLELSEEARERVLEIEALVLLAITIFVGLACLSAGRGDNLCGSTGEVLATFLLGTFGQATWLIVLCCGLWGSVLFTRAEVQSFTLRGSGLLLCMVSLSALLAHLLGDHTGRFPPGGMLGEYINTQLIEAGGLGEVGTRIVLVTLTLITFVLATDILYYAALASGARWVATKGSAVRAARAAKKQETGVGKRAGRTGRGAGAASSSDEDVADEDDALDDEAAEALALVDDDEDDEADDEEPETDEEADTDEAEDQPAAAQAASSADDDAEDEDDEEEPDDAEPEAAEDWEDDLAGDPALEAAARSMPRVREPAELEVEFEPEGERPSLARAKASAYVFPSLDLLEDQETVDQGRLDALLADKTGILERTLTSFRIEARVVEIQKGPVISMFEMELAPGIKVEKIRSLEDDLAIALKARTVRIVAPIPGKNTIGIEVPNPIREVVRLKPLLGCKEYKESKHALPIFLGRDAAGYPLVVDLAKMPHLLVAGATGSGKSVCLNTIICSILFTRTPEQVKLILLDPKMVELSQFGAAPHLACPVVSDMKRAPGILDWAVQKMEERYRLLSRAGVRNIYSYNKLGIDKLRPRFGEVVDDEDFPVFLPFIVIVVDELADLMMTAAKDVETSITRLAAKSRAVGIHIILATQRPSTNVITGLIKANLPTRVAFMVSSKVDSRVILDVNGAEQLLGQGDMLFLPPHTSHVVRGQCTFLSEEEVAAIMADVGTASGPGYERELVQRRPEEVGDPSEVDDLYDAATRFIIETRRGSASLLQRKFAIGYTRASRLIDLMAEEGVLGEYKGSQAREVEMTLEEWVALNPEARGVKEEEAV